MRRPARILDRILDTGPPGARRKAEALARGMAGALASSASEWSGPVRLSDALSRPHGRARGFLEALLGGSQVGLIGTHLWELLRREFNARTGAELSITGSKADDARALERALEDTRRPHAQAAGGGPAIEAVPLSDDLFAERDRVLEAARRTGPRAPILLVQNDAGIGKRQGLLSAVSGSKGRICLFGQTLLDLSRRSAAMLAAGLPTGRWTVIAAGDSILFPTAPDLAALSARTTSPHCAYLFAPGSEEVGLPDWARLVTHGGVAVAARLTRRAIVGQVARRLAQGALAARELLVRRLAGGEDVPSFRILPSDRVEALFREYPGGRPIGGGFFWYQRPTTALRCSFDEWMLLWEPGGGPSTLEWADYYHRERRWVGRWEPLCYGGHWLNANTPVEVMAMARAACLGRAPLWRAKVRSALGLPEEGSVVRANASPVEALPAQGEWLIHNSHVVVPAGCRLVVGPGVVITGSYLKLTPDSSGSVRIPPETAIVDSHIEGPLQGIGTGSLLYRCFSDQGARLQDDEVQATLFLRDGRVLTGRLPMEYCPNAIDVRTGTRWATVPLFGGLSHSDLVAGDVIDRGRHAEALAKLCRTLDGR